MQQTIEFHKQSLKNRRAHLKREVARLNQLQAVLARQNREIIQLQDQITRAEREGKGGFDPDRYNLPRSRD